MQQYLDLLKNIKENGTWKSPAREGMPKTLSLFGAQYRCKLSEGFPILTTKEVSFKNIVTELLWFLRGDTNIKYLVDNGCNIWNEDAYNYYLKVCKEQGIKDYEVNDLKSFIEYVNSNKKSNLNNYIFGDCGNQYGKLWRDWEKSDKVYLYDINPDSEEANEIFNSNKIDQISELIKGLKENPESRRHILTALNPAKYNDLALFPCHVLAQFNCRPLTFKERCEYLNKTTYPDYVKEGQLVDECGDIPKYYLDCSMYQRSCDVFLGVPYNTASYALLTYILAEICGMIPGDLIHTFGDVHIYENHMDQVNEQLTRIPTELPELVITNQTRNFISNSGNGWIDVNDLINGLEIGDFSLENYLPQPKIKAKLSTGLK